MNLQEQAKKYGVCDLEYSITLKKLGVKQESVWSWVSISGGEAELIVESQLGMLECNCPYAYKRICSAFTVAELGEMLPEDCFTFFQLGNWWCFESIRAFERGEEYYQVDATNEANARAKMLIYLKKKLIKRK